VASGDHAGALLTIHTSGLSLITCVLKRGEAFGPRSRRHNKMLPLYREAIGSLASELTFID
jgi:hypothetical protein